MATTLNFKRAHGRRSGSNVFRNPICSRFSAKNPQNCHVRGCEAPPAKFKPDPRQTAARMGLTRHQNPGTKVGSVLVVIIKTTGQMIVDLPKAED